MGGVEIPGEGIRNLSKNALDNSKVFPFFLGWEAKENGVTVSQART